MNEAEVRNSFLDFSEIAQLAEQGMMFVGCRMGMSSSRWIDWQDQADEQQADAAQLAQGRI